MTPELKSQVAQVLGLVIDRVDDFPLSLIISWVYGYDIDLAETLHRLRVSEMKEDAARLLGQDVSGVSNARLSHNLRRIDVSLSDEFHAEHVREMRVGQLKVEQVRVQLKALSRNIASMSKYQVSHGYHIYQLWVEGYLATGMEGTPKNAEFLGEFVGRTLAEAAIEYGSAKKRIYSTVGLIDSYPVLVTDGVPSTWGCRIFDNEDDARRLFG